MLSTVERALLIGMIVVIVLAAAGLLGGAFDGMFAHLSD
jgi:Flp pilus assembly pilin Flp